MKLSDMDLAQKLRDYHLMHHTIVSADVIFVLCSNDLRVAEYAADLYLQGYAPYILFSGGTAHGDDLLATNWGISEAEMFAKIAKEKGVPMDKILLDVLAENTGQNIVNGYALLKESHVPMDNILLVQKPFMQRRTYATFMKQWPGANIPKFIITSPNISFTSYPNISITQDALINILVGDTQRIIEYPAMGFQISQEVPDDVLTAYHELIGRGYTKHLFSK